MAFVFVGYYKYFHTTFISPILLLFFMKTGYKVADVMSVKVLTARPSVKLDACARLMAKAKVGSLVLLDGREPVGIVTEQDLARKVLARGVNAKVTSVSKVMSKKLITISPHDDLYTAMVEMGNHNIKHLLVMQDDKLVGIVSFKDIIKVQPALIEVISFKSSA